MNTVQSSHGGGGGGGSGKEKGIEVSTTATDVCHRHLYREHGKRVRSRLVRGGGVVVAARRFVFNTTCSVGEYTADAIGPRSRQLIAKEVSGRFEKNTEVQKRKLSINRCIYICIKKQNLGSIHEVCSKSSRSIVPKNRRIILS